MEILKKYFRSVRFILVILIVHGSIYANDNDKPQEKGKIFWTVVKYSDSLKIKGVLYQVSDSFIVIELRHHKKITGYDTLKISDIQLIRTKRAGATGKGFLYGSLTWSAIWLRAYFVADNSLDRDPGYIAAAIIGFPIGGLCGMLVSTITWNIYTINGQQGRYVKHKAKLLKRSLMKE